MADNIIESASSSSSSVVQQPPTSTSHINPVIPLIAAEIHVENQIQMATTAAARPSSDQGSSSVVVGASSNNKIDEDEPDAKRPKLDDKAAAGTSALTGQQEKLESRLGGILCCAVCLDLPKTAMYQCQMGHLMCAACFTHLLADGRLRDQVATCPNCRVEISKSTASRNLAVEKAASELPSECQFCNKEFPSKSLKRHESFECQERPTDCKYARIGCHWKGPQHEAAEHETACSHPQKSAYEVMSALEAHDAKYEKERKLFMTLIDLLSYEKIIFNDRPLAQKSEDKKRHKFHAIATNENEEFFMFDLQLKPYRTDEYVHRLFYETSRFTAFNNQWVVKARINNSQRDPHQSNDRQITYQLILKTKTSSPLPIHFFALKGPFSDMKVDTQIYRHEFTDQSNESEYYLLPLPDSSECNRLLAAKAINFRLLMFLLAK